MGPTALLPLRRMACWGIFRPKNPVVSAGWEHVNLGTKEQHAASRPPKPLSLGYDLILSSYRILSVVDITTNISYFKSAHFLSQFLTRYKVTYTSPALHQFYKEQFFLEIRIKRNFGSVQIFKHHPYLSVRRLCDFSLSAPSPDKPFYMAVPVHISIT
jgi:hypothetical protein